MPDFGRAIISKIIDSGDITAATDAGIRPNWFDDEDHRRVYSWMIEYFNRYSETPTRRALKSEFPTYKLVVVAESYEYYMDRFSEQRERAIYVDGIIAADEAIKIGNLKGARHQLSKALQNAARDLQFREGTIASVRASEIEPETPKWLWYGRIPLGKLTVLAGDAAEGKTTMVLDIIARLSQGVALPGSKRVRRPITSLIMSAEDNMADTLVPRLMAAGADREHIHFFDGDSLPSIPGDIDDIKKLISRDKIQILLIDPFNAFLHGRIDSYRDSDIRRALAPLSRLAEETGVAIILIFHLNKSMAGKALHRIVGSVGIGAAARAVLFVVRNPNNESERVLVVAKMNNAAIRMPLRFRIEGTEEFGASRVVWTGKMDISADDLLNAHSFDRERPLKKAEDFIRRSLPKSPDGKAATLLKKEAEQAGISRKTLERAKTSLGIESKQRTVNGTRLWFWYWPNRK